MIAPTAEPRSVGSEIQAAQRGGSNNFLPACQILYQGAADAASTTHDYLASMQFIRSRRNSAPTNNEVVAIDPPASHRDGPIFLNVLRVLDVPEAFGLLAPRPLTIATSQAAAFDRTQSLYRIGGGNFKLEPLP